MSARTPGQVRLAAQGARDKVFYFLWDLGVVVMTPARYRKAERNAFELGRDYERSQINPDE